MPHCSRANLDLPVKEAIRYYMNIAETKNSRLVSSEDMAHQLMAYASSCAS